MNETVSKIDLMYWCRKLNSNNPTPQTGAAAARGARRPAATWRPAAPGLSPPGLSCPPRGWSSFPYSSLWDTLISASARLPAEPGSASASSPGCLLRAFHVSALLALHFFFCPILKTQKHQVWKQDLWVFCFACGLDSPPPPSHRARIRKSHGSLWPWDALEDGLSSCVTLAKQRAICSALQRLKSMSYTCVLVWGSFKAGSFGTER